MISSPCAAEGLCERRIAAAALGASCGTYGCTNAARLWQELRDREYASGQGHVRHYLARFRGNAAVPAPAPAVPKVPAVTSWIMTKPDRLEDHDKATLDAILTASPQLAASVRAFAAIMNKRRRLLESWMTAALATGEPALRSSRPGCAPTRTPSPAASASGGMQAPSRVTSTA